MYHNKLLAKRASESLKAFGYQLKLGQVYKILSRLSGFKSFQIAKKDKADLSTGSLKLHQFLCSIANNPFKPEELRHSLSKLDISVHDNELSIPNIVTDDDPENYFNLCPDCYKPESSPISHFNQKSRILFMQYTCQSCATIWTSQFKVKQHCFWDGNNITEIINPYHCKACIQTPGYQSMTFELGPKRTEVIKCGCGHVWDIEWELFAKNKGISEQTQEVLSKNKYYFDADGTSLTTISTCRTQN